MAGSWWVGEWVGGGSVALINPFFPIEWNKNQ